MADWLKMNTRQSMLLMILSVAVVFGALAVYKFTARVEKPAPTEDSRTQSTIARVVAILFTNPSRLNDQAKREFWATLRRAGRQERLKIIGFLWAYNNLIKKYQVAFLHDARVSLKTGKAHLSKARSDLEKMMIDLYQGIDPRSVQLASKIVETNRRIMALIAAKKPVVVQGRSFLFTQKLIERLEKSLPAENRRRDALLKKFLTPPTAD